MNFANAFVAWRQARRTERQLSRLSDHELNDLGINRRDIASIANRSYRPTV